MGAAAYMGEGVKRNWQFVDFKSILSGAWYGDPLESERWSDCVDGDGNVGGQPQGVLPQNCPSSLETQPLDDEDMEELENILTDLANDSVDGDGKVGGQPQGVMPQDCPSSLETRPLNGYILPGVLITIAHDGYAVREGARDG